ncbi:hypothetical protein EJ02DRAFT_514929 [Clathrospora elynae]|uniref:Protein kinase domain-containing protein n=1 Tax=Clathrospora elynae TaxID=706981 RepID=A0A6A5SD69_9PLEO|nr:hypothetical protein EJ02DRAFT_514929 [Clathrospora elynae]
MAQSGTDHKTHVINFTYDNEDGCTLTALINDVRFHITLDPKDFQKSRERPLYYEYLDKISAIREADEREEDHAQKQQAKLPSSKRKDKGREGSEGKDSGVDVTAGNDDEDGEDQDQDSESAELELRNWILAAFADVTNTYAPPNREPEESTLYEWYHGPTYFYRLHIKSGELVPELLQTTDEMNEKIEDLVPRMKMPKYIQDYNLPWLHAEDLVVETEVSFPEPAHPGKVIHRESGDEYFFKPVVPDQPGPVKREIQILTRLSQLDTDIKVPELLGFVSFSKSKTEAMGLLLSHIDSPTPLTHLLKSSIPSSKRETWSKKTEEYISILHSHDIIWGDAKADNFVVDANDELWIIDFGGSYTEGWVDPELSETIAGDKMGLEKIQAALEDPVKNTSNPARKVSDSVRETASSLARLKERARKMKEMETYR